MDLLESTIFGPKKGPKTAPFSFADLFWGEWVLRLSLFIPSNGGSIVFTNFSERRACEK